MAKQDIDIGVEGNDGTGDSIRESFRKVNENFQELYAVFGAGGQISFTNLGDTPNSLNPRKLLLVNDSGTALEYQELASDSGKGTGDPDSITISYDIAGKIILSTSFRALSQDLSPTLGAPLDGDGRGIARVSIDQNAVNDFNATHPGDDITIDDLVITKGYADNRYIAGVLPIRVDDEPVDASEYILEIEDYTDGNITVTDHGYDNTVNGTPFVFKAEDTDPSNLASGTTYYLRYASPSQLSVHRTKQGAIDDTDQAFVTFTIDAADSHTMTDAGYDENLEGFFLSNEAMPRKSIVRRQGDAMTGPLVLHDSPGELAGLTNSAEDLQAATKFYVDNTSYSSPQNLFVSTTGDDTMRGVPSGKEGTSWSYAYRSINAAARRAEEMIKASDAEPGPYMQTITRDNQSANAEVVSAGINNPLFNQARNLIEENREYIIREITAYLNFEYPDFEYNIKTCERDLGLILDAIAFDINKSPSLTDATANSLTRRAGERYYNSASGRIAIGRQLTETVDAINIARDIVEQILQNRRYNQVGINSVTQANIATVTTTINHGLEDKNIVLVENVSGMTQVNDQFYYVKVTGDRTFELFLDDELEQPLNSAGFTAYAGQGNIGLVYQTDEKQFRDIGDDADPVARQAVIDKFNLVVNIMSNGIDSGATTSFGKTYRVIVNNGGLVATDQGNIDNRDISPGKILVGKISGAQGRIVTYNQNDPNFNGNDNIEVHLEKAIDFIDGEDLEYGNFVKTEQVTIFIESGQYEEDYPIKVAANVSIKGDEFRRVIIRPKNRVSQSPWAGTYTYRDRYFDGLEITRGGARFYNQTGEWQGYFGYHYLSDPEKVINTGVPVANAGEYNTAANIITENREFIQNEIIEYINQNTADLLYDKTEFGNDLIEILDGIAYDIVLDTTFNARRLGLKFQRDKSIYKDQQLKDLWVVGLTEAKRLVGGLPAVSSSSDATTRANAAFDEIIDIIENGVLDTDDATVAPIYNTVNTTDPNEERAKDRLLANIEFIAAEALAYLQSNYPRKYFNEDIRLRDARNMSYALAYDIMYGGNSATVDFIKDMFIENELRLEIVSRIPTLEMITHIKTVISSVVQNVGVLATTGNTEIQDLSGTPATATEATTIGLYVDIIYNQINNQNLLNIPSTTYPSLVGLNSALVDAKTGIDGGATSIRDAVYIVVDASPEAVFTYNQTKCKRDVGLIADAIAKDLERGGDENSLEVQGEYFESYIQKYNNNGFGGQENVTRNAIEYTAIIMARLFQGNYNPNDIWQNTGDSSYIAPDFKFGTAELGTNVIVNNLVDRIVFAFDRKYNPPLRNDEMDVFLMNDATILRNMTVQGHGGFLCVLDPAGQILTKSPYVQTGSSFSKSINSKIFAGGMFVDAYVGNLPASVPTTIDVGNGSESGKINNLTLWVRSEEGQGLFIRPPELPCPFYLEGRRFQVNAISDYDQGNGWCKIYLDPGSNDGNGFDETLFEERPGDIARDLYLQTAGNRSMLGNDFTQINDLGYALVTTNGAFSEMVSMFTYYCQAAYYAANGSEIRSLNGSNGYGNFGLVAEGADPNEIPDQVTYEGDMTFPGRLVRWFEDGEFVNVAESSTIYVTDFKRLPEPNSKVVTGIHTVTGIGAADPSRASGQYPAVTANGDTKGATFNVTVDGSGAATISIAACGEGYADGDSLTISDADLGGGGAADLVFTVDKVYGSDGTLVLPTAKYDNKIYGLQITGTPAGTNGDFFSNIQDDIPNGEFAEYRHSETHRFDNIRNQDRLVTRPSTAINFDESDDITYRSIAFSSFDSQGNPLDSNSITVTFEVEYDNVEFQVDTGSAFSSNGQAIGDLEIAINDEAEGFVIDDSEKRRLVTDINGNLPPATLENPNASDLIRRNIEFVQEEVIAWVNATYPSLQYIQSKCYRDIGYILSAIDFDIQHSSNNKTVDAALYYWDGAVSQVVGQTIETIAAINKAKEIVADYILTQTAWTAINTNGATQDLTGTAAEPGISVEVEGLMDIITDVIANGVGVAPDKTGYSGGMVFTWAGRTHQIIRYNNGVNAGEASINIYGAPRADLTDGATQGINQAFTENRVLRAGLPDKQTAEITISISLCRATGHDFTQIGTGSFNDSNYPNVILGDPENTLAPFYTDSPNATSAQVWERRKGRVFWMSTDQFGFFRVGKFFEVDQGQGSIKFSGEIGITGANALGFKKGVTIDEFSIDDTMADESDTSVPVEKAIVSYINKRLGRDKNDNGVSGQIGPGFLPLSGTPEMTGDLQMGANKITNLQNPEGGSDASTKSYVDTKITEFDSFESVRNTETNRVESGDLVVFTGSRKVYTTVPEDSSGSDTFEVGDNIEDVSGNKTATIVDVYTTTDLIIGENEPSNIIAVITYDLTNSSAEFNQAEDIQGTGAKSTVSANIIRGPFDEIGHAREATGSIINLSLTRTPGVRQDSLTDPVAEFNLQIENDSIIDADINSGASIAQSKLLLERAKPLGNSSGLYGTGDDTGQGSRGSAAFDSAQFAHEVQLTLSNPITANQGDIIFQNTNKGTVVDTIVNNTLVVIRTTDNFVADSTVIGVAEIIGGVERIPQPQAGVTVSAVNASGYIGIKDRGISLDKLDEIATDHLLGRSSDGTGIVESIPFESVVDQGFGLLDVDFENSEIDELSGTVLTFASPVTISDGETLSQSATGASATVQGKVESETSIRIVNVTGTFNATAVSGNLSGPIGAPVAVANGVNFIGQALVKQAEGVYGTTSISIGSANDSIARRTDNGSLQATSYIIGGTSTNVILAESGGTLTMTTPAGGTILEANGGNASNAPRVDMPGSVNIGDAGATDEGNAQGNVSGLTGTGYAASPWNYTNFIEALDTKESNNTTGFALGAPSAYTNAAAGTIIGVSNNTEALVIANTGVESKVSFSVASNKFTVNATNGNTVVAGNLSAGGTLGVTGATTLSSTLAVTGETSLNGNVNLGDNVADTISVTGSVDTDIIPTGTRNLGSGSAAWDTVYGTTFSGTATTAKYADLAENYLADMPYDPGTVVVLGGEHEVTLTSAKGDQRVAGVVSTDPAHLMNSHLEGDNVVAVALTGRVPCKVLGRVAKGDILVTSAIPGYAIVDNKPAYGTIIGKAVGAKDDDGKGVVEVLVGK